MPSAIQEREIEKGRSERELKLCCQQMRLLHFSIAKICLLCLATKFPTHVCVCVCVCLSVCTCACVCLVCPWTVCLYFAQWRSPTQFIYKRMQYYSYADWNISHLGSTLVLYFVVYRFIAYLSLISHINSFAGAQSLRLSNKSTGKARKREHQIINNM